MQRDVVMVELLLEGMQRDVVMVEIMKWVQEALFSIFEMLGIVVVGLIN